MWSPFVFIFLGIAAFAAGSTFGAVINSFIPVVAGGGLKQKKEIDPKEKAGKVAKKVEVLSDQLMNQM